MEERINRRDFLKKPRNFIRNSAIVFTGSLIPKEALAKMSKEYIRKVFEPRLDSLTRKIVKIESDWRYWKVGSKEDIGLMQVTPIALKEWNEHGHGREYGIYDLFDPYVNLKVGTWYLHDRIGKHYLPHYKLKITDENKAASYNAGPPTIGEIGDATKNFHKLPKITRNYLIKLRELSSSENLSGRLSQR